MFIIFDYSVPRVYICCHFIVHISVNLHLNLFCRKRPVIKSACFATISLLYLYLNRVVIFLPSLLVFSTHRLMLF